MVLNLLQSTQNRGSELLECVRIVNFVHTILINIHIQKATEPNITKGYDHSSDTLPLNSAVCAMIVLVKPEAHTCTRARLGSALRELIALTAINTCSVMYIRRESSWYGGEKPRLAVHTTKFGH